jgi:hypothetical protein
MREKTIESYLREQTKARGGKAYKLVSPGNDGMPDRMVCLPVERVAYVETKAPGKKSTALQKKKQAELRAMGFKVYAEIDSKEKVDALLQEIMQ